MSVGRTDASPLSVVLVLFALVAFTPLHVVQTGTLAGRIALQIFRSDFVAFALFTTLKRKTVLTSLAMIAT